MWNDPNWKYRDYVDPIEIGLIRKQQAIFDRGYYVDIATGETKKRLYVNRKQRNLSEPKEEEV